MTSLLLLILGCGVCGPEFSDQCYRVGVSRTCVDPGPAERIDSSADGNLERAEMVIRFEIDQVRSGGEDFSCVHAFREECPSGAVMIGTGFADGVGVAAYDPSNGKTIGYMSSLDHDQAQKCDLVWVGREVDRACASDLYDKMRDTQGTCRLMADSTCDFSLCAPHYE